MNTQENQSHHTESCGCGCHHDHSHHQEACGCHHPAEKAVVAVQIDALSDLEMQFLTHLMAHHYLPVAQYVVKSSKESAFESIALTPVHMQHVSQSMQEVKEMGALLLALEEKGFIELDFDLPLTNYLYEEYHKADLFAYFQKTVEEAKANSLFLGDTAVLECGSIAPTEQCVEAFQNVK